MVEFVIFAGLAFFAYEIVRKFKQVRAEGEDLNSRLEAAKSTNLDSISLRAALPEATESHTYELFHPGRVRDVSQAPAIIRENIEFAVLDLETTGLFETQGDRIVQVGVVIVNGQGKIQTSWTSVVNPGRRIPNAHMHGITDAIAKTAPTFSAIADQLVETLEGRVIVAHNASFDLKFLRKELAAAGKELEPRRTAVFDTMSATYLLGRLPDKKMMTVAQAAGVEFDSLPGRGAHDAETDTHATAGILEAYLLLNPDAVWQSVRWPFLENHPVQFLTKEQFDIQKARFEKWLSIKSRVENQSFEPLPLDPGSEIYLSNFDWEDEAPKVLALKRLGYVPAASLTKSRTKLVVVSNLDEYTQTPEKAEKWGIPIVTWEQFRAGYLS